MSFWVRFLIIELETKKKQKQKHTIALEFVYIIIFCLYYSSKPQTGSHTYSLARFLSPHPRLEDLNQSIIFYSIV